MEVEDRTCSVPRPCLLPLNLLNSFDKEEASSHWVWDILPDQQRIDRPLKKKKKFRTKTCFISCISIHHIEGDLTLVKKSSRASSNSTNKQLTSASEFWLKPESLRFLQLCRMGMKPCGCLVGQKIHCSAGINKYAVNRTGWLFKCPFMYKGRFWLAWGA